jgi:CheY-like chemotaxis protein
MHRVRISIRYDNEAIALSISDTGPGIASDVVERIFDPFFTTKRGDRETGGSGLGLSISRSILHDIGGDLIVESVHGAGATFIAVIPTEGRRVIRHSRFQAAIGSTPGSGRSSVLVVEDEEALLRSLATALRQRFHVLLAADGQEAIDLLESGSTPDAILCDINMPVVNGFELYEWLLDNRPDLARHVVFITANATDEVASTFFARVEKPVLEKPVTRERLLSAIDRIVSSSPLPH